MSKKNKYYFRLKEVIILVLVTSFVIALSTGLIVSKRYDTNYKDFVVTDENISKFLNAYQVLTENYYQDINKQELMDNTISSMFNYLKDPYTTYLNESETKALVDSLKGQYEGIGVEITNNEKGIEITTVLNGSPASESGIKVGDIITKVNEEDVTTKNIVDVANAIKMSPNNKVEITLLRELKEMVFNLNVREVDIPSITYRKINDSTYYIDVETFSLTTSKQVREQINNLDSKIKSLIIDLRNNTGGYLSTAEDMAKIFIEKGKVIYSIEDKNGTKSYKDNNIEASSLKIVVLMNGNSASASEVLAGALKDSYGAILVGTKSYGKGKVQQAETLKDGSMLKYTVAKWLRPNGECVDGIGIIPDYEVLNTDGNDEQLLKAIELLNK